MDLSGTYPYGYYIPTGQSVITVDFASDGSSTFPGINVTYFLEERTAGLCPKTNFRFCVSNESS